MAVNWILRLIVYWHTGIILSSEKTMSYTFNDPVKFYLVRDRKIGDLEADFQKINNYLLTFTGDINIKKEKKGLIEISYSEVPFKATLKAGSDLKTKDIVVSRQMTLTCEKEDNLSVNLIKNVTKNIGYRIFNPQINSYLVNSPNILDLTTIKIEKDILEIFKKYNLKPFFQYKDTLIFFAKDKQGKIHLVNRHLLEYLIKKPQKKLFKKEFSVLVARDIGRFIALFDRGLVPISFYKYRGGQKKIINLSGLDVNKLEQNVAAYLIFFDLNKQGQEFKQIEKTNFPQIVKLKRGQSLVKKIDNLLRYRKRKYLMLKISQDINYLVDDKGLTPKVSVLVFMDS
jgi:hypothetical protein